MTSPFTDLAAAAPGCPSAFALDLFAQDAATGSERALVDAHLAGCAACRERLAEVRRGFDAFPDLDERRLLAAIRTEGEARAARSPGARLAAWLRALRLPVATLAAASVALVLSPREEVRTKGSLGLEVHRLVDGRSAPALSGDVFHAGDRLRFSVDLPVRGAVRIYGVEASGGMYTAWPRQEGEETLLGPGNDLALPGAVALDESVGREVLWLVQCEGTGTAPACAPGPDGRPACPAGCAVSGFELDKRPR